MRRTLTALFAGALTLSLAAAGCAKTPSDGGDSGAGSSTTTTIAGDAAAFADRGPFPVGVTTLRLEDRSVEVWYPAVEGAPGPDATYSQLDALPPNLAAAAPNLIPAGTDLTVTMPGVRRDAGASTGGPFPLVLFSHGFGSFRLDSSNLVAGIASWGFVVAAPDHLERGRAAMVTNQVQRTPGRDEQVLDQTIDLVLRAGAPLAGLVDAEHIGAVGHSAGGRAVMNALPNPRIDVAVGWAAAGRDDTPAPDKPTLNIAARNDVLVPLEGVTALVEGLRGDKRFAIIDGAGHNSFTDICLAVRSGNDLIGVAQKAGLAIPERMAAGGRDGCGPESIDTKAGWRVIQHLTVAKLRRHLGVDTSGAGLDPAVAARFAPITVTIE